jgi:hypothetical protein
MKDYACANRQFRRSKYKKSCLLHRGEPSLRMNIDIQFYVLAEVLPHHSVCLVFIKIFMR